MIVAEVAAVRPNTNVAQVAKNNVRYSCQTLCDRGIEKLFNGSMVQKGRNFARCCARLEGPRYWSHSSVDHTSEVRGSKESVSWIS